MLAIYCGSGANVRTFFKGHSLVLVVDVSMRGYFNFPLIQGLKHYHRSACKGAGVQSIG